MADFTHSPQGGGAPAHLHPEYAAHRASGLTKLTNMAGAAVSLALVVGVGVWGYKLLVRDVTGIPVVRAAAGEMRIRPENPGGQLAEHQGLSVNTVAAIGSSEMRADELRLAPQPTGLEDEDQPMAQLVQEAGIVLPGDAAPAAVDPQGVAQAPEDGSVDAIIAQLTAGVAPMDALEGEVVPVLTALRSQTAVAAIDGDGPRVSLRPAVRPTRAARAAAIPASASGTGSSQREVSAASLPAGTRLVQLGAFDTPEIARAQWETLTARFAPFMEGKQRIVMEAKSGGRTFYRLRAEGFADIGDARRFCSAFVAESVDCIPVVTR